ncbi:hypothetical protein L7F22_051366 [Adiantum nelumboides]|nr:hypothetical protein [Adiantum nelumboides]
MGSLASTLHIHQAEIQVPIQPPQLPEMPEFQGTEEEEQLKPAPGALHIREKMEQEIEDLPEGPAKEYLRYEKKVMQSAALAFLQPEEQVKDFGTDFLPLPLMRHEAILWKEKMRPAVPRNEDGGYEDIPLTSEEAKTLIEDHPSFLPSPPINSNPLFYPQPPPLACNCLLLAPSPSLPFPSLSFLKLCDLHSHTVHYTNFTHPQRQPYEFCRFSFFGSPQQTEFSGYLTICDLHCLMESTAISQCVDSVRFFESQDIVGRCENFIQDGI